MSIKTFVTLAIGAVLGASAMAVFRPSSPQAPQAILLSATPAEAVSAATAGYTESQGTATSGGIWPSARDMNGTRIPWSGSADSMPILVPQASIR